MAGKVLFIITEVLQSNPDNPSVQKFCSFIEKNHSESTLIIYWSLENGWKIKIRGRVRICRFWGIGRRGRGGGWGIIKGGGGEVIIKRQIWGGWRVRGTIRRGGSGEGEEGENLAKNMHFKPDSPHLPSTPQRKEAGDRKNVGDINHIGSKGVMIKYKRLKKGVKVS